MKHIKTNHTAEQSDFTSWDKIGEGDERTCYLIPSEKNRCLKISLKPKIKQSKREISYFKLLLKNKVPFTHIPKAYSYITGNDYLGIEQEIIKNSDGSVALDIRKHTHKYCKNEANKEKLLSALNELYAYMIKFNIIPCDLMLSNVLIQVDENSNWKAFLIDGLGANEIFPLTNYIKFLGRMKIKRKWDKFYNVRVLDYLKAN